MKQSVDNPNKIDVTASIEGTKREAEIQLRVDGSDTSDQPRFCPVASPRLAVSVIVQKNRNPVSPIQERPMYAFEFSKDQTEEWI